MYRNLRKYETMRDNLVRAYNILSKSEIQDNLATAVHTLKGNYTVNDTAFEATTINKVRDELSTCLNSLGQVLYSANVCVKNASNSLNEGTAGGR